MRLALANSPGRLHRQVHKNDVKNHPTHRLFEWLSECIQCTCYETRLLNVVRIVLRIRHKAILRIGALFHLKFFPSAAVLGMGIPLRGSPVYSDVESEMGVKRNLHVVSIVCNSYSQEKRFAVVDVKPRFRVGHNRRGVVVSWVECIMSE